jgi:P-type Cu+ transporter
VSRPHELDLPIDGMTCASCARRIEKRLNRLDGVHASVSYALERAHVAYDAERVALAELATAIELTGTARRPLPTRT